MGELAKAVSLDENDAIALMNTEQRQWLYIYFEVKIMIFEMERF